MICGGFTPTFFYLAYPMRKFEDSYQHKGLRKKLMDLLREKGISDENVLKAMNHIPRHYFLDSCR